MDDNGLKDSDCNNHGIYNDFRNQIIDEMKREVMFGIIERLMDEKVQEELKKDVF